MQHASAVQCRNAHSRSPPDRATASTIAEALRMKTAFGPMAACLFAVRRQIPLLTVDRVLVGRYDPRQLPTLP